MNHDCVVCLDYTKVDELVASLSSPPALCVSFPTQNSTPATLTYEPSEVAGVSTMHTREPRELAEARASMSFHGACRSVSLHLWSHSFFKRRGSREWLDVHDATRIPRTTGCTATVGRRWEQCAVTMMARRSEKERVAACGAVLLLAQRPSWRAAGPTSVRSADHDHTASADHDSQRWVKYWVLQHPVCVQCG